MGNVDQHLLKELFDYDQTSGKLVWKRPLSKRIKKGDFAGSIHSRGYTHVGIFGKTYKAHRLIWLYMTGSWPTLDIDHIDGNRSNNAWKNLRQCTRDRNCQNQVAKNPKSGFKGVVQRGNSFMVRIRTKGKYHHVGSYPSAEEAAQAYDAASLKYHGQFAKTNKSLGLL